MDDVFQLKSTAFPAKTRVITFRGREEVSHLYAFEIHVNVAGDAAKSFELNDAIGTKATLSSHPEALAPFAFNGILTTVELVHAHADYALFRAVLSPRLARLQLTEHSRLFTDKSIPDVIKAVLEENGLSAGDYELQLTGSYASEEHVCQYHESDFDFISRWMEHLGLYYWFEQGDDAEKLIITDSKSSQTDLPADAVRYVPTLAGDRSAGAAIESLRCRASSLPATVKLKDYDYTKPSLDVSASAPVASNGVGEISRYSGRFFSPGDAQRFAKLRAEEMLTRQTEHFGSGTAFLRAGYQFTIEEHPLDAMNKKYLAVACEHFGNLVATSPDLMKRLEITYPDTYHCDVTAIPASVQFRPKRETQAPRIYGLEHGLIDGEAESDYAQIDDKGRYKVKFFFDESDLKDGKASTWVRQMQPHGGGVEGFHFPLRKGTEVVLSFLGGDPDRPVIAGVVNTTTTPSPVTSGNNTRNVIQTGGRNRIEIEDKAGQERISISSPHANSYIRMGSPNAEGEMHVNSDGTGIICLGKNLQTTVGVNFEEDVQGKVDTTYHGLEKKGVTGPRALSVSNAHTVKNGATYDETTTGAYTRVINGTLTEVVAQPVTRTYGATHFEEIAGAVTQIYNTSVNQVVTGPVAQTILGPFTQAISGPVTISAPSADWTLGPFTIKHGSMNSINVDAHVGLTVGATSDTFIGVKNSNNVGASVTLNHAGSLAISSSFDITVAASVKVNRGASVELHQSAAAKKDAAFMVYNATTFTLNARGVQVIASVFQSSCGLTKIS